ncbi:hypothetical protein GOBAR_DD21401 [Gossypium barbadense]|nr:hypothetical protein GOBAR_DD21401 [Gossypium barbadense]
MDDHILHDQLPLNPIWPSFPLQTPFSTSTTPTHLPSATPVYSTHHNDQLGHLVEEGEEPEEELSAMKEMLYKIAAMQPVDIDPSTIRKPKRRNVRISDDPQSVAARHRRERISEKIRILKRLVPGGTKMDTASMLDEAIRYVNGKLHQINLWVPPRRHNQAMDSLLVATGENPLCFNHEVNLVINGLAIFLT